MNYMVKDWIAQFIWSGIFHTVEIEDIFNFFIFLLLEIEISCIK